MLKLSIITINYNNVDGLKRTVESVLNQTWQEFEYIVIDGGSTDGSATYIESQSNNIDYWISEPDKGIYNAMNKGIMQAKGEYLLFLNSGDHLFNSLVLEQNHHYFTSFDLISFNLKVVGEEFSQVFSYPEIVRFSDLYFGSLPHASTFIKKSLFSTVGMYDENLKIVSDWKFFILALFRDKCTYLRVNELLSLFYLDGISSRVDNSEERNQVLKEYFDCYILDYEELVITRDIARKHQDITKSNRFKLLVEMEKTVIGKKIVSALFKIYIILFSKNKLRDILK